MWLSKLQRSALFLSLILFLVPAKVLAVGGSLAYVRIDYYATPSSSISNYQISANETIRVYPWENFTMRVYRTFTGSSPWTYSLVSPSGLRMQQDVTGGALWTFEGNEQGVWTAQVDDGPTLSWNILFVFYTTFQTNPGNCSILVDGTIYAPRTFLWDSGSNHTISAVTPQQCGTDRYAFLNWSDGGPLTHTITVPEFGDVTYTANFIAQYPLTTNASPLQGGIIEISPDSADGYYNSGTTVQLTAIPNPGYVFIGWSGDLAGSSNPCNLTIEEPRSVTASFLERSTGGIVPGILDLLLNDD